MSLWLTKNLLSTHSTVYLRQELIAMALKSNKLTREVRYFLLSFKLFGLSPFAKDDKWKIVLLLYSIFLLGVTISLVCSAFLFCNIFQQASSETLVSFVSQLVFSGLIVTNIIILLQAVLFRPEAIQIEDRFNEIHRLMIEKLSVDISGADIRRRFLWKIVSIVLFLVIGIALNIGALTFYEESLGYLLHSLWPLVIIRARCIHNIFLVDLITEYLTYFNRILMNIIATANKEELNQERFLIDYTKTDFRHLTHKTPYTELMVLKDVYGYIWDITNLINDTFGWSLLAVATQNFIEFTCNGYWLFLAMDNQVSGFATISKDTVKH